KPGEVGILFINLFGTFFEFMFRLRKILLFFIEEFNLPFKIIFSAGELFFECLVFISLGIRFVLKFLLLLIPFILDFEEFFFLEVIGILFSVFNNFLCTFISTVYFILACPAIKIPSRRK